MSPYRFDLNIEPIFAVVALYDAKERCKISETFHLDCNSSDIQHMLQDHIDERAMSSLSRSGIFNITYPNSDVFLVIRVRAENGSSFTGSKCETVGERPEFKAENGSCFTGSKFETVGERPGLEAENGSCFTGSKCEGWRHRF